MSLFWMLLVKIEVFLSSHYGEFQSSYIYLEVHDQAIANKIKRKSEYKDNLKYIYFNRETVLLTSLILSRNSVYSDPMSSYQS